MSSLCKRRGEAREAGVSDPSAISPGAKGLPTGILFVSFLAEAGKQGLYKQSAKAIVFCAMNRSGEGCFLSPILLCCRPFQTEQVATQKPGASYIF